jgi:type I restriction enzyme S subunit
MWKNQKVPLGNVVKLRKEFVTIADDEWYKRCRVQVRAEGAIQRDRVPGASIKTKKQQICRSGELLVAEIDAKVGGFAVVPSELDGAIVSSHYFLYTIDHTLLNQKFLEFYIKTHYFQEQVAAKGTTNYAAIKSHEILEYAIPLPKLTEQRRVVTKIESIVGRLDEVKRLRQEIRDDAQAMLRSVFHRLIDGAKYRPMAEVAPIVRHKVEIDIDGEYPELGVRSFGRGTFHKPVLPGIDVGSKKLYHIHPGDLVFSNVFAWEGAIAVARDEDVERVGSHRFITCVPKEKEAIADFLCFYFLTLEGLDKIREASPGGAGRNRTLGLKKLEKIEVPIPDYDQQLEFGRLLDQVAEITRAQDDNQTELDAMLPAVLDRAFKGAL